MAAMEGKTEKATPKRREDERKKGNLFQSADVVSSLSILAIFVVMRAALPYAYRYFGNFFVRCVTRVGAREALDASAALDALNGGWAAALLIAGPAMLASVLAAVVTTGAQTRFKFSHEKIKFRLSNISPLQGFKRLFSLRSVVEVLKAAIKMTAIGSLLYLKIRDIAGQCIRMMNGSVFQATVVILQDIFDLVIQMSAVFLGIAALDYFYQWWEYERSIRMSKQELKEEYKELEGNPETKGRQRQEQRRIARRRMMQQVPTADVVVRNPTHVAVALRYDAQKDSAPVVVAKGLDLVARRIVAIAEQNGIPMKEDKPLARALYAAVEIGMEIPPEFYTPLAEIMAWVYRQKKERKR